jgi:hypothetical protein
MTSDKAESQPSGRNAEIRALSDLHGLVQEQLRGRFGDDQPQPSRDELERRWGEQLRSHADAQPMSKMFF